MKKNTFLYILLLFLIIVNGFFLYNYLGKDITENKGRQGDPLGFILKQLDFDDAQLKKLEVINENHHVKMMHISEGARGLKDALFSKISDPLVAQKFVDSITNLIGMRQAELDKEAFNHFRKIEEICTDEQKEKFKAIIQKAIGKGRRKGVGLNNRQPPTEGAEGFRPPPPERGDGYGPPPHLDRENMRPPPHMDGEREHMELPPNN